MFRRRASAPVVVAVIGLSAAACNSGSTTKAKTTASTAVAATEMTVPPTTVYVPPTTAYVLPTTVYVPPTTVYVPPATAAPAASCPNGSYINSSGNRVCSPYASQSGPPAGATAQCNDGTYSFSQHHQGTCSGHGGVAQFYN